MRGFDLKLFLIVKNEKKKIVIMNELWFKRKFLLIVRTYKYIIPAIPHSVVRIPSKFRAFVF